MTARKYSRLRAGHPSHCDPSARDFEVTQNVVPFKYRPNKSCVSRLYPLPFRAALALECTVVQEWNCVPTLTPRVCKGPGKVTESEQLENEIRSGSVTSPYRHQYLLQYGPLHHLPMT
jgi:hypothetical protein